MAIDDWIEQLLPFSQAAIESACSKYLRDQPRRRPTPGDIRVKCREPIEKKRKSEGDRSALTYDELALLDEKILPAARRWLGIPALADFGRKTLDYWGEA